MTEEQANQLEKSLKKFGLAEIPAVNVDGTILAGHQRMAMLKKLGKGGELIDVRIPNRQLTDEEAKEYNLRSNKNTGEWDFDKLLSMDEELLKDVGFDEAFFDNLLNKDDKTAEEDDFEQPDTEILKTDIKLGDVIEIGEHRLMCGDSTSEEQVLKLMNGQKADMVFTDPPYGIGVVKSNKVGADFGVARKGKYSEVIADDTTDTAKEFYKTCVSLGFDKFIIWGGNYFTHFLPFSDGWLVWNKRAGTDIRNTFADGEMAWCSFHTPIRIYDQLWNGMIREGEKDKRVHPTQKPIRMLSEIIEDHVKGSLIFDGFLGSGSTMVAAHQLGRKCYGMELDPKYCQVIVNRMRALDDTLTVKINGSVV
jgi:DNA modification methylase